MTDRAEIERLLNRTGRTLEGLPTQYEYFSLKDYGDRCEELDRALSEVGFESSYPCLFHQSDVIELLVGALRDALDKPKNRPFSKEEIEDSVYVIPCVIEEKKFGLMKSDILKCSQIDKRYYGMYEALTSIVSRSKYDIKDYGKTWRCWASRPTDEERSAAAWES